MNTTFSTPVTRAVTDSSAHPGPFVHERLSLFINQLALTGFPGDLGYCKVSWLLRNEQPFGLGMLLRR